MEVKGCFKWQVGLILASCIIVSARGTSFTQEAYDDMPHHEVQHWAQRIGNHLYHLLDTVAGYAAIDEKYKRMGASISPNDGLPLVKQMADDVSNMMKHKVQAVMRIMNVAEEVSQDTSYLQDSWEGYFNSKIINQDEEYLQTIIDRYGEDKVYNYYGSRLSDKFNKLSLKKNSHFDGLNISLNASTVHVATNVFEGGPGVIKAIRWSEALEKTFASNYEHDPTLSWQFFGSANGFLRQYPGAQWEMDAHDPDLYDSRLRSWYIQAANTPKDMVILLDISGSMTGLRKEIAKHVVINILDTLNENDFISILIFNQSTTTLVPCFNNTLVQANLENVGVFKRALVNISTGNIANFSQALTRGFKLLQELNKKHNETGHGAQCNQVIMLVTDGAPLTYEKIFKKYNWPQLQIRVFTYLIGREITDSKSLRWMACSNKGYFVHVTTPSEVREQVLKYIPVIARPMVMYRDRHPIIWTGVYADIADPKQTAWLWELRERERQKARTINYRKLQRCVVEGLETCKRRSKKEIETFLTYGDFLTDIEVEQQEAENARRVRGRRHYPGTKYGYKLLTTVSVPVFNRTQKEKRVADLLGVAGTDVPIREIKKLIPPYKLGVNGYSYMVNKNGHILFHPDLRPTFQDILKPNYNSVDLSEVELTDFTNQTWKNISKLFSLRRDMIEQTEAVVSMTTRFHLDGMKRVQMRDHKYSTTRIPETPFSLGISLPMFYGSFKVNGQIELSLVMKENVDFDVENYFRTENWSLHPEWVYCEYKYDLGEVDRTPEELMMHFLRKAQLPGWKWRSTRSRPPPQSAQSPHHQGHHDYRDYYCDKTLVQSLLFDAEATRTMDSSKTTSFQDGNKQKGSHKSYGITTTFVATRSGFSRWKDLTDDYHHRDKLHFMDKNKKAIDEIWYKRAVDYYNEDKEAYVYSVPFDSGTRHQSQVLVTASRAIFIKQNKYQIAPAAVVGVNIRLDKFMEFFKNETHNCHDYSRGGECKENRTCESNSLDCYLLDDNGFIIGSEYPEDVGKFFGSKEGTIMNSLVQSEVYNLYRIYDYQAVCLSPATDGNFASILMTPLHFIKWMFNWIAGNFVWLLVKTQLYHMWDANAAWAYTHENNPDILRHNVQTDHVIVTDDLPPEMSEDDDMYMGAMNGEAFPEVKLAYIKKTRPRPCDKEVDLYKLNNNKLKIGDKFMTIKGKLSNCHADGCGKPFSVQKVIKTNLVLIVVHSACKCQSPSVIIEPQEVKYTKQQHCNRLLANPFRVRPDECIPYHADEITIHDCDGCPRIGAPSALLAAVLILSHLTRWLLQQT